MFGSDGDRDRGKRPMMGEIAARLADVLVVTDENPRSEEPAEIRAAILDGVRSVRPDLRDVHEVEPRAEAIRTALGLVGDQDTVIVTGKGHEPTQEIAGVFHRYNDRDVFLAAAEDRPGRDDRPSAHPGPTLLDRTGGATVDSVRIALRDLASAARGSRSFVVVGRLGGEPAVDDLDGLGRLAVRLDIDRLVAVGDVVRAVHTGAFQEGSWGEETRALPDVDAATRWILGEVGPEDVVLVADGDGGLAPLVAALRAGGAA